MDELDFTHTPAKSSYDPVAANDFFKSVGREEILQAGKTIFVEDEKGNRLLLQRDKIYLLLDGEVELAVNKKVVGTVHKGEIFGEMAFITRSVRSATATTKMQCRIIALDDKQFHAALSERPEFAITMMGVMVGRLREMIAHLNADYVLPEADELEKSAVFDKNLLAELEDEIGEREIMRYHSGKIIMQEGHTGVFMYVVLEGQVAVTIHNHTVEIIGPGGMFGEMALLERAERLASAVAETDCVLLPINRNVFLELVKDNPEFGVTVLSAVGVRALYIAKHHAT